VTREVVAITVFDDALRRADILRRCFRFRFETFLVLLMSRPAIPRRPLMLERLNWARSKAGKRPLLPDYLRRSARAGAAVRSRTVTWTIESPRSGRQG
jgi:hypothetical protein